jgi:hypothetical protein
MKDTLRLTSPFVTVLFCLFVLAKPAASDAQDAGGTSSRPPSDQVASLASGSIHGLVRDEAGTPVAGATVSALGNTPAFATTDKNGRYEMRTLSPGRYVVRAHQPGYSSSKTQLVEVRSSAWSTSHISLRRAATQPKILTASVVSSSPAPAAAPTGESEADPASNESPAGEGEVAWRLRHPERRSILKSASLAPEIWEHPSTEPRFGLAGLGEAADVARRAAGFIANPLWSGEVNLLTTGSFYTPEQLFSSDSASHGIAYLSLSAPIGDADWTMRGAITRADLSSWSLAGSYHERETQGHQLHLGMSYSTQRYDGGNPLALRDVADGSRNVGELFGFDTVSLGPAVSVNYGARYARYDYLLSGNLISPRVEVTIAPGDTLRVKTLLSRRALAPGSEEFVPPSDNGLWLPPQRTFSSLEPGRSFTAEFTTHAAITLERDLGRSTVAVRGFHQEVEDQLVTLFGAVMPGQPIAKVGHYQVGSGGDARATGGAASIETIFSRWVKGSIEYSVANAVLVPDESLRYLVLMAAPDASKARFDLLQNFDAEVEADFPETSTRVLFLYRLSNGFARASDGPIGGMVIRPALDSRFDLQVRQALPFMGFSSARWEALLAVRNFFHDPAADQSIFDEMLVVRPPKRVIGGLTLIF